MPDAPVQEPPKYKRVSAVSDAPKVNQETTQEVYQPKSKPTAIYTS